eukprot:NODE_29_length_33183_cov_0.333666.p21 type:complete len:166 gc:universal NODE_29_length_33183_cov_0.333666:915-1412(+)
MYPFIKRKLSQIEEYRYQRWLMFFALEGLLILRMIMKRGFSVLGYIQGLTILNLFFESIYSSTNTEAEDDVINEIPLHTIKDIEAPPSPLIEQNSADISLSGDVKLWFWCMVIVLVSLVCTFIDVLDIPVYWQLLLVYFLLLFTITMREPLWIMITKNYTPMNHQ